MLDPYMEPLRLPEGRLAIKPARATFSAPGSSSGYERFVRSEKLRELLRRRKYNCFAVRVDLLIVEEEPSSTLTTMLPPSDLHSHLGDLLSGGEHTDVEFRVGDETFAAHRLLLGARSPVFKAELLLRPGPDKHELAATTMVVQIDDVELRVFKAMLSFMYTDTWPEMGSEEEPAMSQRLLVAADRYGLQRLKLMCEYRLSSLIDGNSVEDILHLAEKHQCAALKEACFDFIGSTASLVPARERLLQVRETEKLQFDRLVSLCPTITKDQISNVLEHDYSRESVRAIDIILDIE
ncbi:hypothetical protein C2845_PM15G23890 [Panicum miliaceum]|uniref:BTB domain-containing protein n=1 Tax=Panicum miliaceum TaxID=4540 RepID=A0A3L6Q4N5_PANMI|nr:hypothetical protein C2845_PM15G23890 [Panicum miliaceum]